MAQQTVPVSDDALTRVQRQFKRTRAAKAVVALQQPPPTTPSLMDTLARYREAGLLSTSRKGARQR